MSEQQVVKPRLTRRQRKWLKSRWKELQEGPREREWTDEELINGVEGGEKPQGIIYAKARR